MIKSIYFWVAALVEKHGERSPPPPKPGKFAKDKEQSTSQPAMRIDISKISKFSFNFFKFLLKFSKQTFKIFN